jgi:NAD+ synthase (glutamine-hydrolysing)
LSADTTEENLQARCRGVLLMSISNKKHRLVLTTGNKSELAVGYSTLYGDMAGGFDALKDCPKLLVYALAALPEHLGLLHTATRYRPTAIG